MMTKIQITLLLFTLLACKQTSAQIESYNDRNKGNAGWKTFNGTNYAIRYPSNWELNQSGQMGTRFILFSPLEDDKDQFKENVNLLVQDLTNTNVDLDKFVEISEGQVIRMITNSNIEESTRMKSSKPEFHKMIYSGYQGIYHLKFEQFFWVIDQQAFILTFTCEQSKFPKNKETGEKILKSFLIKK